MEPNYDKILKDLESASKILFYFHLADFEKKHIFDLF